MWSGYKEQNKRFLDFIASKGLPIKDIHTSGHADIFGLQSMVEAVKPKHIVPIHTFEAEKYKDIFIGTPIKMLADGETVTV
jgi:ribonuclease J